MSKFIKIIFFVTLNFSLLISFSTKASEKIKIGLMVPLTGENKELGQSIIKAVRLAVKDINNNSIEIIPKDTASKANKALKSAFELKQMGVKVVIGPVFYESLSYLDEIQDIRDSIERDLSKGRMDPIVHSRIDSILDERTQLIVERMSSTVQK